jgi:uncharacterized protein (UPF0332 family)
VTPGQEELARHELELAVQALRAAGVLLTEDAREDAVSRAYYACFHAVRAALVVRGLRARTHTGTIRLFAESYGAAPELSRLFQMRAEADYAIEPFTRSRDEVDAAIDAAPQLVARCANVVAEITVSGPDEDDPPPDL